LKTLKFQYFELSVAEEGRRSLGGAGGGEPDFVYVKNGGLPPFPEFR